VPSALLRSMFSYFTIFLNELDVVPPSIPHVLVFGMHVVYQVCSVMLCTAHLIHNMHTKTNNTCGIGGGTGRRIVSRNIIFVY
jgi:hypothetical protein